MNKTFKLIAIFTATIVTNALVACVQTEPSAPLTQTATQPLTQAAKPLAQKAQLLTKLPYTFNSPASFTIDNNNNVLFTSPNLHNKTFVEQGIMDTPAKPRIGMIDEHDNVTAWYVFQAQDMEPTSGVVTPMGISVGPDGNVYVADFQLWFGGESRLLRINVKEGKALSVDVVAKGFSFPNALAWKGKDLFISDTVLSTEKNKYTTSGIYKISWDELNADNPLQISAYKNANEHDPHLFETFNSNGSLGFGANGLTIDGQGNIYTTIMEEGSVLKTVFDDNNNVKTTLFAQGMVAGDGIHWHQPSNALYTTDLFANAVYRINMTGKLTLLAKNGNTDGENGELDAPSEVIVRGNKAYVANFDTAFGVPTMLNTKPDAPVTLSVIQLK